MSSDASDADHRIAPLRLQGDGEAAWSALQDIVADLPRTQIVKVEPTYLHAEAKSRLFGFIDDVEFHLRPDEQIIAARSAARTGHSDFGVNRARIETIRSALEDRGSALGG